MCASSKLSILKKCKENNIYCFYIQQKEDKTYFYTKVMQRKKVLSCIENANYLYTTGWLGMCLRNLTCKYRLISYSLCIVLWYLFSTSIFRYEVYGNDTALNLKISDALNKYTFTNTKNETIKQDILKSFGEKFYWFEIYRDGNVVTMYYSPTLQNHKKAETKNVLIAKKDGMIAYFDCIKGYKVKNVHDLVYKGEILVDNKMYDSYQKEVNVDVEGSVFAYTWQKVIVEIKDNKLPDAINYFSLLLEARSQINIQLNAKEKVVKENILHFDKNEGKIKLIILYTLLEDITS